MLATFEVLHFSTACGCVEDVSQHFQAHLVQILNGLCFGI